VVADLVARGYLDDAQFARHWVQTRASVRLLGPLRLRDELRARGVEAELAEAAVRESFDAEGELTRALEAGRRKLRTLQSDERVAFRLRDHLLRRGYPGGVVTRVVRTLLGL
jgi:regulatory protein